MIGGFFDFDMENTRDMQVVNAERDARAKKPSVLQRAVDCTLDMGRQMLTAHEFSMRMQMRNRENDNLMRKDMRSGRTKDTIEDVKHQRNPELERRTADMAKKMAKQTKTSDMEFE